MASTINVHYNEHSMEFPQGTTETQARESLKHIYPEIANATSDTLPNGDIVFKVTSGTKGAGLVAVYSDMELPLPEGTTEDQARDALRNVYPEVANAEAVWEDNDTRLVFKPKSGTKG